MPTPTPSLHRLSSFLCGSTVLLFLLAGCGPGSGTVPISGGGGGTTTPTLSPFAAGAAADVYVTQNSTTTAAGSVLEFATGAGASATPVATLTTNLTITAVATDNYGVLYVAGETASGVDQIQVFAANATGAASPTRTITIVSNYPPTAIAADAYGNLITVDGNGTLNLYGSTATGSAVPTRTLYGPLTGIAYPFAVTLDPSGNTYVSVPMVGTNPAAILVFGPTATGNVAPIRTITTNTPNSNFYGVATDPSGNLYATLQTLGTTSTSVIQVFAPTATGAATPLRTIGGSRTLLAVAEALRTDVAGNLYILNITNPGPTRAYSVEQFPPSATGNVAPAAVTTSTQFTNGTSQLALR